MQSDISHLFADELDLSGWTFHRHKDDFAYGGTPIPGLSQDVYRKDSHDGVLSVGIFSYRGELAYLAWGYKDHEHCSYHARINGSRIDDVVLGCPDVRPITTASTVTGFTLDDFRF